MTTGLISGRVVKEQISDARYSYRPTSTPCPKARFRGQKILLALWLRGIASTAAGQTT